MLTLGADATAQPSGLRSWRLLIVLHLRRYCGGGASFFLLHLGAERGVGGWSRPLTPPLQFRSCVLLCAVNSPVKAMYGTSVGTATSNQKYCIVLTSTRQTERALSFESENDDNNSYTYAAFSPSLKCYRTELLIGTIEQWTSKTPRSKQNTTTTSTKPHACTTTLT